MSSSACMYNLNASAFYIALVLLHEYFTQKAPYTTEVSLRTWSISFSQQSQRDRMFSKTASLQFQFFAINDVIASVVAVKSVLLRSRSYLGKQTEMFISACNLFGETSRNVYKCMHARTEWNETMPCQSQCPC